MAGLAGGQEETRSLSWGGRPLLGEMLPGTVGALLCQLLDGELPSCLAGNNPSASHSIFSVGVLAPALLSALPFGHFVAPRTELAVANFQAVSLRGWLAAAQSLPRAVASMVVLPSGASDAP